MTTIAVWTSDFLQQNGAILEGLGKILNGVGEVVPLVGGPIKILGVFAAFVGARGSQQATDLKETKINLESLLGDLEKTFLTLSKYSDEDRKDSRLTLEVKISLTSCVTWAENINSRKIPPDLNASIKRRVESLKFSISQETLEQTIRVNQRAKILIALAKLDKKKPWEYYEDGKYLITQKRWLDAKTNFLCYRKFIDGKTTVMTEKDDNGVKPPSEDRHLKYLAYIQDQLAEQSKEEPDPILSVCSKPIVNQYKRAWDEWEATYMKRK
jgi:hypothetical protein